MPFSFCEYLQAFLVGDVNVEPHDQALAPLKDRFVDSWEQKNRRGRGDQGFTGPAKDPHLRIDYIYMDRRDSHRLQDIQILAKEKHGSGEGVYSSDHFALMATIGI
jgi:endonuclease/exonuclease/phosphatase family metal-dependent hydrolase